MPKLTRLYIKSAFVYLAAALALGLALALPSSGRSPLLLGLTPAYFHLFMVGWVTQMIFGVIYWMFPIVSRAAPRGDERVAWAAFYLLNAGLLLRVVGEPLVSVRGAGPIGWLLVLSAALQWLGAVCFVVNAWPRVKEKYRGG